MLHRRPHPADHEPAFRAIVAAAPPLADLARELADERGELVRALAIACGDLAHGFAAPVGSLERRAAHHRAWIAVRELDRGVTAARLGRRAPARVLARAQRAIDRADVMISALPGVLLT
ncbi:MAG: hypothetical protein ACM31C_01405 [Acidobacteriota bacterium]